MTKYFNVYITLSDGYEDMVQYKAQDAGTAQELCQLDFGSTIQIDYITEAKGV